MSHTPNENLSAGSLVSSLSLPAKPCVETALYAKSAMSVPVVTFFCLLSRPPRAQVPVPGRAIAPQGGMGP